MKISKKLLREERERVIEDLKDLLTDNTTIYTARLHTSNIGDTTIFDLFIIKDNEPIRITYKVCKVLDYKYSARHRGITVKGCNMDMAFDVVYSLSCVLYGFKGGYKLTQRGLI